MAGPAQDVTPSRSLVAQVWKSWTDPRGSMREQIAAGHGEERALFYLMGASVMIFIARLPGLTRGAGDAGTAARDLAGVSAASFIVSTVVFALLWYGLAALAALWGRGFGVRTTFFHARLALFWASFAAAPLLMVAGGIEAAGYVTGSGALIQTGVFLGLGGAGGFWLLWLWSLNLLEAAGRERSVATLTGTPLVPFAAVAVLFLLLRGL